jgi:transposase
MSPSRTRFMGMAVHQDTLAVASVAPEHGAEVTSLGPMGTRQGDLDPLVRTMPSNATHLILVYEAGPCGDWRSRDRRKKDDDGWVVAPALRPKKAGARVKTDRRDAGPRARLARSGDRTTVDGPTGADDARRDLSRAREETLSALTDAQLRRTAFWRRHDRRDTGRATWGPAPLRWLSDVVGPTPAPHMGFHAEVRAVTAHTARLQRFDQALHEPVQSWRLHPVVEARQALRGVQLTVAVTMVAAMGDLSRFETPRALLKCWGVSPAEDSSGDRRPQGSMPTAGHTHARRALVEGAWAYRAPAKGSRPRQRRLEQPPKLIQAIRGKAQVRRCQRDRRRVARGQQAHGVTVAMAREWAGFLGALAKAMPVIPSGQTTDAPGLLN